MGSQSLGKGRLLAPAAFVAVLAAFAAVLLCAGCGARAPKELDFETRSIGEDPCAERLHELCGPLLQYFAMRGRFPEKLEDLRAISSGPLELECPASGKPYVYERQGVRVKGRPGLVIVRDAAAVHSGLLWAISVLPAGGAELDARVIALPESAFEESEPSEL